MGLTEQVLSHPRTFLGTCRNSMPLPKPGQGTGPGKETKSPCEVRGPRVGGSSWRRVGVAGGAGGRRGLTASFACATLHSVLKKIKTQSKANIY